MRDFETDPDTEDVLLRWERLKPKLEPVNTYQVLEQQVRELKGELRELNAELRQARAEAAAAIAQASDKAAANLTTMIEQVLDIVGEETAIWRNEERASVQAANDGLRAEIAKLRGEIEGMRQRLDANR
jgi:hypothetical protein